jgi:electron transport complex protein RnfG
MFNLKTTENIWLLGLFLGIIGLVSAFALAVVSSNTESIISAAKSKRTTAAISKLGLPAFNNHPETERIVCKTRKGEEVIFMRAANNGEFVGAAAEVSAAGYGGEIKLLIGFSAEGEILALTVQEHKETPGLGANVCDRKFQKTIFQLTNPDPDKLPANPILDQFSGRSSKKGDKHWLVKKDGGEFEFITGATVSCRAVTEAAQKAAKAFSANADRIRNGNANL